MTRCPTKSYFLGGKGHFVPFCLGLICGNLVVNLKAQKLSFYIIFGENEFSAVYSVCTKSRLPDSFSMSDLRHSIVAPLYSN